MTDPFEIIVGTYEQFLLGYKVTNVVKEYKMEKSFATHSHLGSLRSVASNKHYLASGGADDSIYLYDMRHRVESGRLMHHTDTVNCIAFTPEASHIFTCSNDGTIAAVRCGNWQVEKHWLKPHKGLAVNTLAIHPTGKMALSTGADGTLRTWNLVKGRQAYAINLMPRLKLDAKNITVLKWSPNGEKYLLAVNQKIDVYSVELAGIDNEIKFDAKIVCIEFLSDNLIAVGLENGQIKFYDLDKSVQTMEAVAHDIRVKCMAFRKDLLVTASSSGEIKLWRYSRNKLQLLQSVNCGARITCLSLAELCKTHVQNDEVKLEEEQEVKKKQQFRLRQEVVIEDEDNWEVTSIETPQTKRKSKKKRNVDEVQEADISNRKKQKSVSKETGTSKKNRERISAQNSISDETPRKKKKTFTASKNDGVSVKKRKEDATFLEANNNAPTKKLKKPIQKLSETNNSETKRSKTVTMERNDDVPSKKRKKKMTTGETAITLKKKKKVQ